MLFDECASTNFCVIVIKSDRNILVLSNIVDPSKIIFEEDVISCSKPFIMDDITNGDSNVDENVEKILHNIKKAFTNAEKEFCLK